MPASGQMEKYFSREPYYIPPAVRFINGSRCLKRIGCWNNSSEDLRETEIQRASCAVLARVDAGGHARAGIRFYGGAATAQNSDKDKGANRE